MGRPITTTELARRLCVRNHPHLRTTNAVVPCGQHLQEANRYWFLATHEGKHSFEVVRDAREEFLNEVQGEMTTPTEGVPV